jgi:uncharacterized protein with PIN domain
MRVLGVDVAMGSWDTDPLTDRERAISAFFSRARSEARVILTTSRMISERSACPQSRLVSTKSGNFEQVLVEIFSEFGLSLDRDRFLTVCGKCGGPIEEVSDCRDKRLMGRILPVDRPVFVCVSCAQPYWWNDQENSSPAKAMKRADHLHKIITESLGVAGSATDAASLSQLFEQRNKKVIEKRDAPTDDLCAFDGLKSEEKMPTDHNCSDEIIKLTSVFQSKELEPRITNWNGDFKGYRKQTNSLSKYLLSSVILKNTGLHICKWRMECWFC